MVSLEVVSMAIQPGEGLCTQFTVYVGLFFRNVFLGDGDRNRMVGKIFDAEMAIHGSKWWAVFRPTLYITVNRLKAV